MKSWIFIGILIALMSSAAYYYYSTTQDKIQTLITNNAILEENIKKAIETNKTNIDTIDKLVLQHERIQADYRKVQDEFQIIRMQNTELRTRLGNHDIGVLAAARPLMVERIINNATGNTTRCFELLSGSPLNEKERNAKDEKSFNSECPWMYHEFVRP